jgi:hypothetical protein
MNDLAEKENKTKETNIVSIILNAKNQGLARELQYH